MLAIVDCVGGALSLDGCLALTKAAGMVVDQAQDLPETAFSFLRGIKGKLLVAEVASKLGKLRVSDDVI